MNKEELKEYLMENLTISINEEDYGYNGKHTVIKLELEGEVLSEEYIDITRDSG